MALAVAQRFLLGWEEWVALPGLGLPAIKAKVDTGARTSALHAHLIEPFGPAHTPMVRFSVHPIPRRTDIEVTCSAPILDRREVTSSNGDTEKRYVIVTPIEIGERCWPIEVTLTNRETMAYRMLIGRQAIQEDMFVDATTSFRQPRLSFRLYRGFPIRPAIRRPLRLGVLTRKVGAASNGLLRAAAELRGHVLEVIDADRLALVFDGGVPGCRIDGSALPHFDAIIPRLGAGSPAFAVAALRQLQMMGSYSLNGADALVRLGDPVARLQALAARKVAARLPPLIREGDMPTLCAADEALARIRCMIAGRSVVAAVELHGGNQIDRSDALLVRERRLAIRAARALRLRLAAVDVQRISGRSSVVAVSAVPLLSAFPSLTAEVAARTIIADIEAHVRSLHWHPEPEADSEPTPGGDQSAEA
ncbi:MAG: RimK/LysX family protein [Hyphomicrobiaceae bacterium]|nr:RimK/LysX family protein [Hyphomicrobiaceae bacterium]